MTRYLVAVGGSGQHVALATADYLMLAEAVLERPLPPIQFFLLDSDPAAIKSDQASAWDLCLEQLKALQAANPSRGIPQPKHDHPYPELPNGIETARQAVISLLGPSAAALLLSADEADVRIREGYFGKPHIAGILTEVLLRRVDTEQVPPQHVIRQLEAALRTDAKICLAGSTVGGTGAGVLPRLVEYLAAKNERAKICANIGLEWFQINPSQERGIARQVQMPPNATASVWHYVRERARDRYRLVLWGHPAVGHATHEDDAGDRFQPVKHNLSLPIHASAATIAFLLGDEFQTREVTPVIDSEQVNVPRSLDFGRHDLHWLIERNRDLLGRLAHLRRYITDPYRGAVVPWLRSECRVDALDKLSADDADKLVQTIDTLTKGKMKALERLGASDDRLAIGPPIARSGITSLRSFASGGVTVEAITKTLAEVQPARPVDSALRLIRNTAMNRQPFPPAPSGTRQPLETGHIDAVAQFDIVEAERVPDIRATERILESFFTHATRADLADPSTIINRFFELVIPQRLDMVDGDRVHHWVHRWLFLLNAVVAGVAQSRPLERPIDGITDAIYIGSENEPIGYLTPALVVVPNFGRFWCDDGALQSVGNRCGSTATLATWLQIIEGAALCAGRVELPQWLKFTGDLFHAVRRRSRLVASARTLPIRLGDTRFIPVPNDAESRIPLVDAICTALGVPIQDLQMADTEFDDAERSIWEDLNSRRVPFRPIRPADSDWTPTTDEGEIVWGDLLNMATSRYRFDDVVLYPLRTYGWRRRSMARFIIPGDVVLDQIAVMYGADGRRSATVPVRAEYVQLVANSIQTVANDGSVHVEITFAGRAETYTRRYSSADVVELPRLTILSWPAMSSIGSGSHSLLITDNSDVRYRVRVVYADEQGRTVVSRILENAADSPHYLKPADHGVTAEMKATALTMQALLPETGRWIDLGFLPARREDAPNMVGSETWAVDFGTSSTVIVRAPLGAAPLIVRPTADRDATTVYACGASVQRKKNAWYHTWDDKRPAGIELNTTPSQLINKAAIRGENRKAPDMVFGRDFMVDHGEEFENARRQNVIDNLKWKTDPKHRVDYLTHLLEQAVTMEIARAKREQRAFPSELRMVFTLPLRQHSGVDGFAKEINGVAAAIRRATGVTISPAYQWESLAVAPIALPLGHMIVVADLGGGTLDMYARYRPLEGKQREAADSARIGGRYCFTLMESKIGDDLNAHRYFLRVRGGSTSPEEIVGGVPRVGEYFKLIYRYVALWTAALRKKWTVPADAKTHIQLAGMTWSLPGAASSQANAASILSRTAKDVGHEFEFMPYERDLGTVGADERKVALARSAATHDAFDAQTLRQKADQLEFVLGLRTHAGKTQHDESIDFKTVHPPDLLLDVPVEEAKKLYPNATTAMLAELTFRMKSPMDPRGIGPGGYDTPNHRFGLSPLTVLAELAVEQIAPEAMTER